MIGFRKGTKLYCSVLLKCPRCHEGDLFLRKNPYNFKYIGKMPTHCPVCEQKYSLEPGFWFGAAFLSYAINVIWGGLVALILGVAGMLNFENFIWTTVAVIIGLTPYTFHLSRSIWIAIFIKYRPTT